MLNENIKMLRKSKGLSQEELAVKLNVVRQTISKWENGLSVPDSDMLISISEALDTSVGALLGENMMEPETDTLKAISEKLEVINLQLAQRKNARLPLAAAHLMPFEPVVYGRSFSPFSAEPAAISCCCASSSSCFCFLRARRASLRRSLAFSMSLSICSTERSTIV